MIFSLEVLQAKHGDCLLLHYGNTDNPKIAVVDGGPGGVYTKFLKPRLIEIRDVLVPGEALPLSLVMVSHLDDDHVNGICMMVDDVQRIRDNRGQQFIAPRHFWFNTFDDVIGNIQLPKISAAAAASSANEAIIPDALKEDHELSAVIASTSQGRQLRDGAKALNFVVNSPFTAMGRKKLKVVRADTGESKVTWDEHLTITVVHPNELRMQELQEQWDKDLQKALDKGDDSIIVASLADKSPFNLSSIVCVVEVNGKKILLTGDGRSDDILTGLENAGFLENGDPFHVDILKMPHHGSFRNLMPDFLQRVTADHYVISADGKHDNPDTETLIMLADHVEEGTLYFTNQTGAHDLGGKFKEFLQELNRRRSKLAVVFLPSDQKSFVIDLEDKVDY